MFVVTVVFKIKLGDEARFLDAMKDNAAQSLSLEPGCKQFDVCATPEGGTIFLYEVYDDAEAFEVHKTMDHFVEFDAKTAPWVADKQVAIYDLVQGGPA